MENNYYYYVKTAEGNVYDADSLEDGIATCRKLCSGFLGAQSARVIDTNNNEVYSCKRFGFEAIDEDSYKYVIEYSESNSAYCNYYFYNNKKAAIKALRRMVSEGFQNEASGVVQIYKSKKNIYGCANVKGVARKTFV
jgi:hypothetical protein